MSVSVARLAAKLGHSEEVRRVEVDDEDRALVRMTNNGLRSSETDTIRRYGFEIRSISPRHKFAIVYRADS